MSKSIEIKYFEQFINTFLNEDNFNSLPIFFKNKIDCTNLVSDVIKEIDNNIYNSHFNSEFALLNYINGQINRLLNCLNGVNVKMIELDFYIRFFNNYTKKSLDGIISSITNFLLGNDLNFKSQSESIIYQNVRRKSIYHLISYLLDKKNEFVNGSIQFKYEDKDQFKSIVFIKEYLDIIKNLMNENYPQFKSDSFEDLPPIYFNLFKNEIYHNLRSEFKIHENKIKNNHEITELFRLVSKEIEHKIPLTNGLDFNELYSKGSYLDSGIKDLLETDDPLIFAKESNNPNLLFLTLTKLDFERMFIDINIDLEKYSKKREDYIYLFKYEIISDFYKLIQSYIQTDTPEVNSIDESKKEDIIHISKNTISPPSKPEFKYFRIFNEDRFNIFEKFYNEFKDDKNTFTLFSCMFDILKEKEFKVIHENLGQQKFRNFLKEYSNNNLDFKPFKSHNENKKSPSYNIVKKFLNPYRIQIND